MSKGYNIRLAEVGDLPFLPELEMRSAGFFPDHVLPRWMRGKTVEMDALVRAKNNRSLWVAEHNRDLVGFAVAMMRSGVALLYEVNVAPEEARYDIGAALVETVVEHAASKGHKKLWLITFESVPAAVSFYKDFGFLPEQDEASIPQPVRRILEEEKRNGLQNRMAMYKALAVMPVEEDQPETVGRDV